MDRTEHIETTVDVIINLVLDDNNVETIRDNEGAPVSPETWIAIKARLLALLDEMAEPN